jgi:hypothetical protein
MPGWIEFEHDSANDVIIARPHWKIETEADLEAWYAEYCTYMQRFGGRKMDFVFVLDDFNVSATVGSKWGQYRARIHKEFVRHNYRVHPNSRVQLFTNTSAVRFDISREEAYSVADALDGIRASRQRLAG